MKRRIKKTLSIFEDNHITNDIENTYDLHEYSNISNETSLTDVYNILTGVETEIRSKMSIIKILTSDDIMLLTNVINALLDTESPREDELTINLVEYFYKTRQNEDIINIDDVIDELRNHFVSLHGMMKIVDTLISGHKSTLSSTVNELVVVKHSTDIILIDLSNLIEMYVNKYDDKIKRIEDKCNSLDNLLTTSNESKKIIKDTIDSMVNRMNIIMSTNLDLLIKIKKINVSTANDLQELVNLRVLNIFEIKAILAKWIYHSEMVIQNIYSNATMSIKSNNKLIHTANTKINKMKKKISSMIMTHSKWMKNINKINNDYVPKILSDIVLSDMTYSVIITTMNDHINDIRQQYNDCAALNDTNNEIKQKIYDTKININTIKTQIDMYNTSVSKMENASNIINEYNEKLVVIDDKLSYMSWYLGILKFDGLPTILIDNLLKVIISDTNALLNQLNTDLQININDTSITFTKEGHTFTLKSASGYESFIIDICTKLIIMNNTTVGVGKILIIDEGLDCIDNINIHNFGTLFRQPFMQNMRVMIISHLINFSEISDTSIEVIRNLDHDTSYSEFKYN